MAMTLSQLEKYMISEIENLHLKMDEGFAVLGAQMQEIIDTLNRSLARIDNHETRITTLEKTISTS